MRVNYINTALDGKASSKTRKLSVQNLPPVRSFSNKDSCGSDNSLLPAAPLHFTAQIINLQKYAREQGVLHEMAVGATDTNVGVKSPAIEVLLDNAGKILQEASLVLKESETVYGYAKRNADFFNNIRGLDILPYSVIKRDNVLIEFDDSKRIIKEAFFKKGTLSVIKDYKNSNIIICEKTGPKDNLQEKLYVYTGCEDIKRPDFIKAKEYFEFAGGKLQRYGQKCENYILDNRFNAERMFTFRRNDIESYDRSFLISDGAEYSNEFYGFRPFCGAKLPEAEGNLRFYRYVKNKVAANGLIVFSSDETLFRER